MSIHSTNHATRSDYFDAEFLILFVLLLAVALASFAFTDDRVNWLLDAIWVAVGLPLIFVTAAITFPFLATSAIVVLLLAAAQVVRAKLCVFLCQLRFQRFETLE